MLLPEIGHVAATTAAGEEYSFRPFLLRVAQLGDPTEIVRTFADLHDEKKAGEAARFVLAVFCDQDDPTPLIGWRDTEGVHGGEMPAAEQIIIARHLMRHGIVGKARPGARGAASGNYAEKFDVAEHIVGAVVHLGLSREDAGNLTMTELQGMIEAKYPDARQKDVPTREEYRKQIAAIMARRKTKG